MKVTKLGYPQPILNSGMGYNAGTRLPTGGNDLTVLTSNGSNGRYWGENVARITANGSNTLTGPYVNFASGSNITFAVSSNTLTIHGQGGSGSLSNATPLVESGSGASGTGTLASRDDHVHPADGGGGGGGTFPLGLAAADKIPASPGTYDEEWEGTADTLPANWSWIGTAPATVKINSRYESLFVLERPGSNGSTYELRRDTFTPGAIDFGLWWKWSQGIGQYNNNGCWMQLDILDSAEAEAQCFRLNSTGTQDIRQIVASVESSTGNAMPLVELVTSWLYAGLTRTSGGSWRAWVSGNGIGWTAIGGAMSHSLTADRFRFRFNSGNNSGAERNILDWVRYRTDLEFPRP